MSDEQKFLTFDEAVAFLPDGEDIHTFMDGGVLLGADWEREEILTALREAHEINVTGEMAQRMKHGLAIKHPRANAMLFIETTRRTDEIAV